MIPSSTRGERGRETEGTKGEGRGERRKGREGEWEPRGKRKFGATSRQKTGENFNGTSKNILVFSVSILDDSQNLR